jgi:hypothetical protein
MTVQALRLIQFLVYGTAPRHGVVSPDGDIEPVIEIDEHDH